MSGPRVPRYISKLCGNRVLVLGGTSGIGFCVAEAALEHGAHVVVSGSSEAKLAVALERLRAVPRSLLAGGADTPAVVGKACDLADIVNIEANLKRLLDFATDDSRLHLDHIVFTAGDPLKIPKLAEASPEVIQKAGFVRFTAPAILAKLLPRYARQDVASSLTLTSGVSSRVPPPGWSIMTGFGAGVEGLMRGLALDLQPIRVNAVAPGAVHTELFGDIPKERLQTVLENMKKKSVTDTVGKPEDVAEAYLYLMKNHFATGSVVVADGGRLLV